MWDADLLACLTTLGALRSLRCSMADCRPSGLQQLSALAQLTNLELHTVEAQAIPALASLLTTSSLGRTLRGLSFRIYYGPLPTRPASAPMTQLLPLSALSALHALSTEWELLAVPAEQLSCLRGLTRLTVDFHDTVDTEGGVAGGAGGGAGAVLEN